MKKIILFLLGILPAFTLLAQPVINSFSPLSDTSGSIVSIKGHGFGQASAANIVFFGAVQATVSTASDTLLTVYVPNVATFQPITVTVNNLTACSANSFIVTHPGNSNGPFTSTSFLPGANLSSGIYPHSITFGDFNNDGKIDMLVSKGSSATVAVYANTSSSGKISFSTQQDLPALGFSHEGSATADFDGDGKLDIVIANSFNSPSVSVYRNTSTGLNISFAPKIDYAADNGPYTVAVGDIDGDGKPDMIVANNGSDTISFYKNTSSAGIISFAPKIDFKAGTNPYSIAIRDLDNDGKPDIAVTTQGSSSALLVMQNTTLGGVVSFNTAINVAALAGPFIVSIGDLDGDGIPDLAVASSGNSSIIVVKNVSTPGNFSFDTPQSFATGTYPDCVALSDLDGDGKPDMISCNRNSNNISVLRNTSTAGNISFDSHVDYAAGAVPIFTAAADLDGDGRADIVCANSSADYVSIFGNIIGANLAPVITSFTPGAGINGTVIKITGVNFTGATAVKLGNIDAASFTVDSATGITAIAGAGASGDVSVTTPNGTAALGGFVYNGPIINSFTPTVGVVGTTITITGVNFSGVIAVWFGGVAAASFTVDTVTNIITAIVSAGSSGSVAVITANGTATLPGFSFGVPSITSFTPLAASVGSTVIISGKNFHTEPANNTVYFGAVKAVVSSATADQLSVIVPAGATYKPLSVTTGNLTAFSSLPFLPTFGGDGSAISTSSYVIAANYVTGTWPTYSAVSDLDNDGKPDLIIANAVSNTISLLKNTSANGLVSFNSKIDLNTGPDPGKIAIGDLDGDGKPDIVVVNFNSGNASTISVFNNTSTAGNISFANRVDYNSGDGSLDIAIADMNKDGKPDLIVTSGNSGFFFIFINSTVATGAITFLPVQGFTQLTHGDAITVADLDNDGLPDLITSNFSDGSISVYRNQSSGGILSLSARTDYPAGSNPDFITTADIDGDGKLDILLSNYSSKNISLYKNTSQSDLISLLPAQNLAFAASNMSVADLNGDGIPDLFCGTRLTGIASILQNTTTAPGNFSFDPNVDYTISSYDTYTNVADLTGDGIPELIVTNTSSNTVSILEKITGIVPVKLIQFNAKLMNGAAALEWETANEINAASIIIERSVDGKQFNLLATIAAKDQPMFNDYQYTDNNLPSNTGEVYYRLKFVDKNGSFNYSGVKAFSLFATITGISVLPNPASSYIKVSITSKTTEQATIKISDVSGKTVITEPVNIITGANTFIINSISQFAHGLYNVQLINKEGTFNNSVLIE
jgi:hypothetical protein